MGLPVLPPLIADFKKEYKFIWYIESTLAGIDVTKRINAHFNYPTELATYDSLFDSLVYPLYVSQMAEQVNVPDDELDVKPYDIAGVEFPVAEGIKRPDITVTYLEDSLNSVYNFHKWWQTCVRDGDDICMIPMRVFAAQARLIAFENTMTNTEYLTIYQLIKTMDTGLSSSSILAELLGNPDISMKPTSIITYPLIFPTKINRTAYNKQGTGLSKVTVTYTRLPNFKRAPALMKTTTGVEWTVAKWDI